MLSDRQIKLCSKRADFLSIFLAIMLSVLQFRQFRGTAQTPQATPPPNQPTTPPTQQQTEIQQQNNQSTAKSDGKSDVTDNPQVTQPTQTGRYAERTNPDPNRDSNFADSKCRNFRRSLRRFCPTIRRPSRRFSSAGSSSAVRRTGRR